MANFLEYGSENGSYLRLEWSKIDTTNTVVLEKDCFKIATLLFSTRIFESVAPNLEFSKN